MTAPPERIENPQIIDVPGLFRPDYTAYPIVDHVADKVAAMLETYGNGERSSRVRDLVDLVILATSLRLPAVDLIKAIRSELAVRGIDPPAALQLPDPGWHTRYPAEATKSPNLRVTSASDAMAIVKPFVEPAINGTATGTWDPEVGQWVS